MNGTSTATPTVGRLPVDLLSADLADQPGTVAFLRELARKRELPMSAPLAFNALAYHYDLSTGRYDPEVVNADRFPRVSSGATIDALPVGAMVQLATGGTRQACEVIFRHPEHEEIHPDGTCPSWLSGAPVGAHAPGSIGDAGEITIRERLVVDPVALGLDPVRLRRLIGRALTEEQHLLVHAAYIDFAQAGLDDTRLYASYLLRCRRPDLRRILARFGPVHDDAALASVLLETFAVLTALLDATGLARWREQYVHPQTYDRWQDDGSLTRDIKPVHVEQFCRATARACLPVQRRHYIREARPAYFAIGPALRHSARDATDERRAVASLRGPRYATTVTCAQLYLSEYLDEQLGGVVDIDGAQVHVGLDDAEQGAGVWRAHLASAGEPAQPVDAPQSLGWLTALDPVAVYVPRQRDHRLPTDLPADGLPTCDTRTAETGEAGHESAGAAPLDGELEQTPDEPAPLHGETEQPAQPPTESDGSVQPVDESGGPGPPQVTIEQATQPQAEPDQLAQSDEEPAGTDAPAPTDAWADDTTVGWTFVLGPRHERAGTVPLTPKVANAMRTAFKAGARLYLDINHPGVDPPGELRRQPVTFDGQRLRGVRWPDSFFHGIRLTVSWSIDSYQIALTSTALDEPLDVDGIPLEYAFDAEVVLRYLFDPVDLNAEADVLCPAALHMLLRHNGWPGGRDRGVALFVPLRELTRIACEKAHEAGQPEPTTAQMHNAVTAAVSDTGAVRLSWAKLRTRDDGDGPWLAPFWPLQRPPDWYDDPSEPLAPGDPAVVLSLHPAHVNRASGQSTGDGDLPVNMEEFLRRGHLRRLSRGQTPRQRDLAIAYARALGRDPRTLDPRITYVTATRVQR